jgi:hypothetical protein
MKAWFGSIAETNGIGEVPALHTVENAPSALTPSGKVPARWNCWMCEVSRSTRSRPATALDCAAATASGQEANKAGSERMWDVLTVWTSEDVEGAGLRVPCRFSRSDLLVSTRPSITFTRSGGAENPEPCARCFLTLLFAAAAGAGRFHRGLRLTLPCKAASMESGAMPGSRSSN